MREGRIGGNIGGRTLKFIILIIFVLFCIGEYDCDTVTVSVFDPDTYVFTMDNSIELTDSEFWSKVYDSKEDWYIFFYRIDCGSCRHNKLPFDRAGLKFYDIYHFGHFNCGNNMRLCEVFQIYSFPTVILFKNGLMMYKHVDYLKPNAEKIQNFLSSGYLISEDQQLLPNPTYFHYMRDFGSLFPRSYHVFRYVYIAYNWILGSELKIWSVIFLLSFICFWIGFIIIALLFICCCSSKPRPPVSITKKQQ